MFSSLTVPPEVQETVPQSSFPWVWVGFLIAIAFFLVEVLWVVLGLDEPVVNFVLTLISIAGWIYWLVCVHRIHKILEELSNGSYPNTPGEAVGKHIIPFYNLYWVFKWPADMSNYINERGRVKMISGYVIGALLLFALLVRLVDGAVGLTWLFATTVFIVHKLKQHVNSLKEVDPSRLPPLPDPAMFQPHEPTITPPGSPQ
ncbi:MAG TPA: hypothetical protein VI306_23680 [Pyrinomonadaceae bacterium]